MSCSQMTDFKVAKIQTWQINHYKLDDALKFNLVSISEYFLRLFLMGYVSD